MRRASLLFAAAASAALLLGSSNASANGRFPQSNGFFFTNGDPNLVLMRVTFGLLISHDRGKTWDWLCERSIGLAGVEDPMFTITPNGTFLGSTFQGLTKSTDKGCNFALEQGALKDLVFIDLTSRPATPGEVISFASSYDGQDDAGVIFFKSTLFETKDEGTTFTPLAGVIDPSLLGETVDLAPSDAERVYVSALRAPGQKTRAAVLLTSTDHAKTFVEYPIALEGDESAAFIAAVDPTNADRVYVRTSNATDKPSRLLVTDDAGKTFRTVFTGKGPLAGFSLAPDGKKLYVGGPVDGLHVASTTDFAFTKKSDKDVECLSLQSDGLWMCSSEKSGFVAAVTNDEGASFDVKLHFCDLRGPAACPAGTSTNLECVVGGAGDRPLPPFPPLRAQLGCESDAGTADGGGDAAADGGPGTAPPTDDGGCSVRGPFARDAFSPLAAIAAAAAALIGITRRKRRQ